MWLMGSTETFYSSINCSTFHSFPLKNTSFTAPIFSLLKAGSQGSNWVKISVLLDCFFFNLNIFLFMWSFAFQRKCILKIAFISFSISPTSCATDRDPCLEASFAILIGQGTNLKSLSSLDCVHFYSKTECG